MLPRREDVMRPRPGIPSAASVEDIVNLSADFVVVPYALTAHWKNGSTVLGGSSPV